MTPKLSTEQRQAIAEQHGQPVYVVDDSTQEQWVLVPAETYDKIRGLIGHDVSEIRESYAAQEQLAAKEGWDDPALDEYNDYDAHRKMP